MVANSSHVQYRRQSIKGMVEVMESGQMPPARLRRTPGAGTLGALNKLPVHPGKTRKSIPCDVHSPSVGRERSPFVSNLVEKKVSVSMPFTRPSTSLTVWHTFQARNTTLKVQDLTPDLYEPAIALLKTYFTRDEPPCKCIGIEKHPSAMAELEQLWRKSLKENVSLVCVNEEGTVVGANVLAVACEGEEEAFQTDDEIWGQLYGAVDLVSRGVDVFEKYGVDKYLTAYGLVVDPKWRGVGVAKEILKARINLCRSLGIKVTATVFTAALSQKAAAKAGFVDLFEMTYEELAKRGCVFPGVEKDTKSSKLMALVIDDD